MKHTIESASRKVNNGWGIGAFGAEGFLRGRVSNAPRVVRRKLSTENVVKKAERGRVIIRDVSHELKRYPTAF